MDLQLERKMSDELSARVVGRNGSGEVSVVEIDGRIFVHNSIVDESFVMGKKAERRACWEQINGLIKTGDLGGNGCDRDAERNGIVMAANEIHPGSRSLPVQSPTKTNP